MPRVAVIDDDRTIVELLADVLEDEGHEVQRYFGADGVMPCLLADPFDLLIVDLRMETRSSGWNFLQMLRAHPRTARLPVIVCSADSRQMDQMRPWLVEQGLLSLHKPFDLSVFLSLVAAALSRPVRPADLGDRSAAG